MKLTFQYIYIYVCVCVCDQMAKYVQNMTKYDK